MISDHNPFRFCECGHNLRRHQTSHAQCANCECGLFVQTTSLIQKAATHILTEMRRNGVEITDEITDEVRWILKEKLYLYEREIWGACMSAFSKKESPPSPKEMTAEDIMVYQAGAFNLVAVAPGGILEVDERHKVLPWQPPRCPICVEDGTKHSKSMCEAKYQKQRRQNAEQ